MCVSRDSPRSTLSLYTLKVLIRGIPIACTAAADSHTPPEQGDPLKRIGLLRGNSLNRARNLQPRPATHSHSTTIALECTQHPVTVLLLCATPPRRACLHWVEHHRLRLLQGQRRHPRRPHFMVGVAAAVSTVAFGTCGIRRVDGGRAGAWSPCRIHICSESPGHD